jgi:hypothetical protein
MRARFFVNHGCPTVRDGGCGVLSPVNFFDRNGDFDVRPNLAILRRRRESGDTGCGKRVDMDSGKEEG